MRSPLPRRLLFLMATFTLSVGVLAGVSAQRGAGGPPPAAAPAEWRSYGGDLGNNRYSPLDLLTPANVSHVTPAWRWQSKSLGGPAEYRNESTPIMVAGTLYFTSGTERTVVAADAVTGATKWTYTLKEGERGQHAPRRNAGRGVAYWTDGRRGRIFTVTPGFQLVALDAETGAPIDTFGAAGVADIKAQLGVDLDLTTAQIGNSSPPFVIGNVVVIPPALLEGTQPPSRKNVPGRIVAIDARTGRLAWRFNTIPTKAEFGYGTWGNGSAEYTGNAGAWAPLAADAARHLLYVPVEAATGDYYGGHRPGDNLFSSTLVCLDATTGARVWHQQLVHHDIWDRDIPTQPILATITVNGRRIDAVIQLTKEAYAFVFDRVTGAPVWPITEMPVQASDVPGERAAATQPVPTKPAPFDRQGVTRDDLIDFTPALRTDALALLAKVRFSQNAFTPPSLANAADGTTGTLTVPGNLGGANWEGGAFDPESGLLYVGSWTNPTILALGHDAAKSDMDFIGMPGGGTRVKGLPILKPPYSRITAIDLSTGDHAWMMPNGDTPPDIKNNAALAGVTLPRTGAQSRPVILVTKTMLVTAEGSSGQPLLHILDKRTGAERATIALPGAVSSVPMTYAFGGRQFIAFWTSNRSAQQPAELVALALDAVR